MNEFFSVGYDYLAHSLLCRLNQNWRNYLLSERRSYLEQISAMGSWAAKEMLGLEINSKVEALSNREIASCFFLDDEATFVAISKAYGAR